METLWQRMRTAGVAPDVRMWVSRVQALASLGHFEGRTQELLDEVAQDRLELDSAVLRYKTQILHLRISSYTSYTLLLPRFQNLHPEKHVAVSANSSCFLDPVFPCHCCSESRNMNPAVTQLIFKNWFGFDRLIALYTIWLHLSKH